MDLRKKLMLLLLAFGLLALIGSVGCKNVCDKMADKMKSCVEELCSGDDKPEQCASFENVGEGEGGECPDELKETLEAELEKDCHELLGIPAEE